MKYNLLMECRAGNRHAFKTVAIIKLADGTFMIRKTCIMCASEKTPIWNAKGMILKTMAYKYSPEYRAFLDDHDSVGARVAILESDIKKAEQPHGNETSDPGMRLVPKPKKAQRRRAAHARKRPRDKRRTQG